MLLSAAEVEEIEFILGNVADGDEFLDDLLLVEYFIGLLLGETLTLEPGRQLFGVVAERNGVITQRDILLDLERCFIHDFLYSGLVL